MGTRLNVLDAETLRRHIEVEHLTVGEISQKYGYSGSSGVYYLARTCGITLPPIPRRNNPLKQVDLSPSQHQIVLGSLLGDGAINVNRKYHVPNGKLVITHGAKQKDYLEWKMGLLAPFVTMTEPYAHLNHGFGGARMSYSCRTITHPAFVAYRALFYPQGKKYISQEILDRLEDQGLAIWLMDDGSSAQSGYLQIATNGFRLEENERMVAWFRAKYGFTVAIHRAGQKDQLRLGIPRLAANQLRELLTPYFFPPLLYKLGQAREVRSKKGETNNNSKLTAESVREIRRRHTFEGASQQTLADAFGVTTRTIRYIVGDHLWRHLLVDPPSINPASS